ncbi:hypothetical protein PZB21_31025, partial [Rhizobium sp. CBK13]|nr:hypothetical protein [Rhizobium sp. CBK13]
IMSLVIGDLSVRLVLNNPTLAENTDGRPQSRSPATAQREARGHSALLPPVSYTRCWDTIRVPVAHTAPLGVFKTAEALIAAG